MTSVFDAIKEHVLDALPKKYPSTIGFKYPTLRDHPSHSTDLWLEGKRIDDGAEGLWRIHNSLYDLSNFVQHHPGGKEWLILTKGTDITEAFEVHHLSGIAETLLPKYYVREAKTPRNSPFTFHEDGFYKTLKRKVWQLLKDVPKKEPSQRSKLYADLLVVGYFLSAILASRLWSYALLLLAGVLLNLTTIIGHNFFHQRNNFRMYYFDFSLMCSRSWRVSHALSHHLYTNTIQDVEISGFEPFFQYLPQKKHVFFRYLSWFYTPIVYIVMFVMHWMTETTEKIARSQYSLTQLIPFTVPTAMYLFSGISIFWVVLMFLGIIFTASFMFGVVGLNAAHHHPELFHDGDAPRLKEELDWGIHQLDCVMDRPEIHASQFLVLTNFGEHTLHHMFPTLDHGRLKYLRPIFQETCDEFGVSYRASNMIELTRGQFLQLSKVTPNSKPPPCLKSTKFGQ